MYKKCELALWSHSVTTADLAEAVRKALNHLKGAQAVAVLSVRHPDRLVAARIGNAGGVAVGIGQGEMFIASDIPAILEHTRDLVFLESRQMVVVTREGCEVLTAGAAKAVADVEAVMRS